MGGGLGFKAAAGCVNARGVNCMNRRGGGYLQEGWTAEKGDYVS